MKQVTLKDLIIFGLAIVIIVLLVLMVYIIPLQNQVRSNTANIGQIVNAIQGAPRQAPSPQPQGEVKENVK